jgi:regulator of nucleoside diphosphate kinase
MPYEIIPVVTDLDAARIRELGSRLPRFGEGLSALSGLIEMVEQEADIVPAAAVEPDVVTVNSTVSFRDELTQSVHRVTVVYPSDMSMSRRQISVLSPVGSALLGRRVGQVAHVALPAGSTRDLRVLELHYQPEAAGHFTR